MELQGKVSKSEGNPPWVSEAPSLGVFTQGHTKKEAISMLEDAIHELLYSFFKKKCRSKEPLATTKNFCIN